MGISSSAEPPGKRTLTASFGPTFVPEKSGKCKPNPAMRTPHEAEWIPKETAGTADEAGESQDSKGRTIRSGNGSRPRRLSRSMKPSLISTDKFGREHNAAAESSESIPSPNACSHTYI